MGKFVDLTGQRFGRLVVIERVEKPENIKNRSTYWLCECDCGKKIITKSIRLKNEKTKSCGCLQKEKASQLGKKRILNLVGERYGRLTVVEKSTRIGNSGSVYWNCLCDCGNETVVSAGCLKGGGTKSCGCLGKELARKELKKIEERNFDKNDLTGKKFGKLTVVSFQEVGKNGRLWKCICECGNTKIYTAGYLNSGRCLSCGCDRRSQPRLDFGESAFNELYGNYIRNARRRNVSFDLSREEFKELTSSKCFYCDREPEQIQRGGGKNSGVYVYNGIDRIDSSIGYERNNIVPCCGECNTAKNKTSQPSFYAWIDRVHAHIHRNDPIDVTAEMMQNQSSNTLVSVQG
jgi:hypothetical protein